MPSSACSSSKTISAHRLCLPDAPTGQQADALHRPACTPLGRKVQLVRGTAVSPHTVMLLQGRVATHNYPLLGLIEAQPDCPVLAASLSQPEEKVGILHHFDTTNKFMGNFIECWDVLTTTDEIELYIFSKMCVARRSSMSSKHVESQSPALI